MRGTKVQGIRVRRCAPIRGRIEGRRGRILASDEASVLNPTTTSPMSSNTVVPVALGPGRREELGGAVIEAAGDVPGSHRPL